jgi:hypothetical protein
MNGDTPLITATGELRWNIKQSFRDYVGELPDGEECWIGPVGGIVEQDLVFTAVAVSFDPETPTDGGVLRFGGAVRYAGHRGMLRVDISDPWIELGPGDAARLTANTAPSGLPERRTVIATVAGRPARLADNTWEWNTDTTTLTSGGAAVLGSVYPPGTEGAGISLHISRSAT